MLSRRGGDGVVVGDLASGAGVDDAVRGATTILHLASGPRHDIALTRTLVAAALHASRVGHDRPHLVYLNRTEKEVHHAYHDGTSWQYDIADSTSENGSMSYGDMVMDAAGRPQVAYQLPESWESELHHAYLKCP